MSGRNASPDQLRIGGRLLGVGVSGVRLTEEEIRILGMIAPAAVVLFARNVESQGQLVDLIASIRECTDPSPVLMIDEEGGRVDRLRSIVPGIPSAAELGACDDWELSRQHGRLIGRLLAELDIECNLAPVVDVWREGLSPSLTGRCYGSRPEAIVERAGAFISGLGEMGVVSCLKHFPGLGVAATDPHLASSIVELSMAELEETDLVPYRALASMAPAVMVSHALYPGLDESGLPGTLSRRISTGLLRDEVGYQGLAITDDMEMHAVADIASAAEIAEQSLVAGNDLILYCSRIDEATSIAERLTSLTGTEAGSRRVDEATLRVESFVRYCGAWAERRENARGGVEIVRNELETLRLAIGVAD